MNESPATSRSQHGSASARRAEIVLTVRERGFCTTGELSSLLGVSEVTIRRDVARLEAAGTLRSVRGGVAVLPATAFVGTAFGIRARTRADIKRRLAAKAVEFIPDSGILAIDTGTTGAAISQALPGDRRLSVVSNSLPVLNILAAGDNVEMIALGGSLHPDSSSFTGPGTLRAISEFQVGMLFLAASGVTERGAFCATDFDAVTKRALIEIADQVVLVADSSKFGASAMARVCSLSALDRVVVDDAITPVHLRMLEDSGVAVTVVEIPRPADSGEPL